MGFTVFPSVDVSDGRCIRPLQGRFGTETVYSDDPVSVARGFASAGARWLHIVDLDGVRTGIPANREVVLEVTRRAACPVQTGGGLVTLDDVEQVLAAGANRAVLGSAALEEPGALRKACSRYGERIVVSLDARQSDGSSERWTVGPGVPLTEAVRVFSEAGASSFLYTDVGRVGTMPGPDLDGLLRLSRLTSLPVLAAGGISSLDDVRAVARLNRAGVEGAVVGRALYEHKFGVAEANFAADEMAAGAAATAATATATAREASLLS